MRTMCKFCYRMCRNGCERFGDGDFAVIQYCLVMKEPINVLTRPTVLAIALAHCIALCGQDPIWSSGPHTISFPQEPGGAITTMPLPTSNDPDIPDVYEYQGVTAQRSQNLQSDEAGNVLFFIVDGNVYNADGLLIADAAVDAADRNCHVCVHPGDEVHIVPVPGSCSRFYVLSLFIQTGITPVRSTIRIGILDMTLDSDIPAYANACVPAKGRFMNWYELYDEQLLGDATGWTPTPVEGELAPDLTLAYLLDGVVDTFDPPMVIRGTTVALNDQGQVVLAIRNALRLFMFFLDDNGIRRSVGPGIAGSFPMEWEAPGGDPTPLNTVEDDDQSVRGQMIARRSGNLLQVAHSSYAGPVPSYPLHGLAITYWRFQLTGTGSSMQVTFTMVPDDQLDPNPKRFALDTYPAFEAAMDYLDQPILRPAVSGLQFSPDGTKIYFVKSNNFGYWYPFGSGPLGVNEVLSTFGYIIPDWTTADIPAPYYHYLAIDTPEETRKLADTQLFSNVGPDGTGSALYLLSAEFDGVDDVDQWLSVFTDPNNPDPANFDMRHLLVNPIAMRTDDAPPEFRLLNQRTIGSTQVTYMQQPFCCEEVVLMRDRSTTITEDNCDLFWEPGNNDFWDTDQPVYIATDLRIAEGAHVTAENMEFRFGENAVLVIEPGASLKCTNCLFTNACEDTRWKGIELYGTFWENQFGGTNPAHQGKLVLRGSTVENAVTGVYVGGPPPFMFIGSGGVLQTSRAWVTEDDEFGVPISFWKPTTIRNCRQGVRFLHYQNHVPGGSTWRNLSEFNDCVFTVNDQYPVEYDFQHHVRMHHVDGINFRACTFENTLLDAFFAETGDHPGSQYLGHGIYSLDAHYTIGGSCNVPWPQGPIPCPDNEMRFSHFIGLDHGIHALQGVTKRSFHANRVRFTNNIAGVFASGVVGYSVVNSRFSIGGRNVVLTNSLEDPLWDQRHRGLFSTESSGMIVDDNHLELDPTAAPGRLAEGIVIGYNRDNNDMVFRNTAVGLERGFIGEGVCADEVNKPMVGLHFQCNTNQGNETNIRSRIVPDPEASPTIQTIRTNQGRHARVADNEFDQDPAGMDFVNDGWQYNVIAYHWATPDVPFKPMLISQGVAVTGTGNTGLPLVRPEGNCANRKLPLISLPDEVKVHQLRTTLTTEKSIYGNNRYLYDQLIDGGNTDEVVQEIMDSWPQDAWDLRDYLLSRSPYLSVEVLQAAMDRPGFPSAMKAEVCIANPDATQRDGFIRWLETECLYPLGESLVASILASWDTRTYRTALENTLAHHHAEMTQAANLLLEHFSLDSTHFPVDSMRIVLQEIRTTAARYAEAMLLMEQGHFPAAIALVQAIPQEHPRLRPGQLTERDRMLAMIAFHETLEGTGRTLAELEVAEVDQLEAMIGGAYDRPATWMQNVLCFLYDRCRTPMTGGDGEAPKALMHQWSDSSMSPGSFLKVQPNPAINWAAMNYDLQAEAISALIIVRDALGRPVEQFTLGGRQSQVVLDTRPLAKGLYMVELQNGGRILQVEKLMVE